MAPDVGHYRRMDPRAIVAAGVMHIEGYTRPRPSRRTTSPRNDGERFVESMSYVRAYPAQLPILADLLPTLEIPVQIIGGLWDWVVPPSNNRFLNKRLPNSKLDLIDSGHFAWEERPDLYADLVTTWWAQH
jgi:pimeloyl-ACP methyl ester carboxylesterase